jgi:hypothetical protein
LFIAFQRSSGTAIAKSGLLSRIFPNQSGTYGYAEVTIL